MQHRAKSIRPFIGADNFELSRNFYTDIGFEETVLDKGFSVFKSGNLAFYLQDASVRDWIDNTMIFMEVEDVRQFWDDLQKLGLPSKYPSVRLVPVREESWGRECFVHDPSGILWHFGEFF
ncbi:VOC family protein [Flavobacterium silvaticum]|uniref:Glyoxalase n=1 Tax=Flavobacterium silvaticum TaxID=1852020 RepID=A0A972FJE1_9FLAO|nr:glyoxalase [Flavobacterium silvaticum]NMH26762.1 glyoxalase [Flavobacterium silvaticum]